MGQLKRTLRSWKTDIDSAWGRLKVFHRVAMAIILAMGMIYIARTKLLDPLQKTVTETYKDMDKRGIPQVVPTIEEDDEVDKLRLQVESLLGSSTTWREKMEKALENRPQINLSNRSGVVSEFERLVTKSGLTIINRSEIGESETGAPNTKTPKTNAGTQQENPADKSRGDMPLDVLKYQYKLRGGFSSIQRFLKEVDKFAYPASLCCLGFTLAEEGEGAYVYQTSARQILMSFHLELYYHGE